jgi:trehalose 6-phosphate phosphatase
MADLNQNFAVVRELLKRGRFGLISDVDGTLSRIAPTPAAARLDPACRQALEQLPGNLALVALVSGRGAADLWEMVGIPGLVYAGNHGLEWLGDAGPEIPPGLADYPARISQALAALEKALGTAGLLYENKGLSASIHYRASADPEAARERILDAIEKTPQAGGLQILENRRVIDLIPPGGAGKGGAVAALIRNHRLDGAIYLGDDRTDIDGFKAIHEAGTSNFSGLAVAVLSREKPPGLAAAADFTVEGVAGVAELLQRLATASQS